MSTKYYASGEVLFMITGYSMQQQSHREKEKKWTWTMGTAIDKRIKIHAINHSDDLGKIISLLYCDLCSKNDGIEIVRIMTTSMSRIRILSDWPWFKKSADKIPWIDEMGIQKNQTNCLYAVVQHSTLSVITTIIDGRQSYTAWSSNYSA